VTEWPHIFSTHWCSAIWIAFGCSDHNHGLDRAESPVNTSRLLITSGMSQRQLLRMRRVGSEYFQWICPSCSMMRPLG
jgi:hypothetical protein